MAVSFEGFSIREYASKMRAVNVAKCWPFDADSEEIKNTDVNAFLPPITVAKFRWWAHELDLARSMLVDEHTTEIERNKEESGAGAAEKKREPIRPAAEPVVVLDDEKSEMACPVCRVFTAATVNAVNAHIDDCLGHASREERRHVRNVAAAAKPKTRAPKKRSIVEIFAVAPQIERVDDIGGDEDEEVEFDSGTNVVSNKKKKKRKTKSRLKDVDSMATVRNIKKEKMKKLKKKITINMDGCCVKKRTQKLRLQSPVNFSRKLNGSIFSKRLAKDILESVSIHKKKLTATCLSAQKKNKVRASKFIAKQKNLFPIRGILKNHKKVIAGQKSSTICKMQSDGQANPCKIQQSDRHVWFSGKDDILGPRMKRQSPVDCPKSNCNLFSEGNASSSVKDRQAEGNRTLTHIEVNGSDEDTSVSTENETNVQPVMEKIKLPVHDHVDTPNFLRPLKGFQDKVNHYSDESLSLSQVIPFSDKLRVFHEGNLTETHNHSYTGCSMTASYGPSYASIPGVRSVAKEGYNPNATTQFGEDVPRPSNTCRKLINYFGEPASNAVQMGSAQNPNTFQQPSLLSLARTENASGKLPFLPQISAETYNVHAFQQPLCQPSPKEIVGNVYSFPEWKQRAAVFGERCVNGEFFGLPLNSQGELIQLNSSGKVGFSQQKKRSTVTVPSSSMPVLNHAMRESARDCSSVKEKHRVERVLPKEQLKLFPVQNFVKENHNLNNPSKIGLAEWQVTEERNAYWQDSMSGNSHSSGPLNSGLNPFFTCHGCRHNDQAHSPKDNAKIHPLENSELMLLHTTQPTMRLMGQDVTVGRSSKDSLGFEDGKVWTDKEIITEHQHNRTALNNSSAKGYCQQDQVFQPMMGKAKEAVACSSDIQSNQISKSILQMKAPESRFSHPYFNWQSHGNIKHNSHTSAHPLASHALFNRAQEPLISSSESFNVGSCIPVPSSAPLYTCQHMHLNSPEVLYQQGLPHMAKPAYGFPFSHPECRGSVQPSLFQNSSKNFAPWLLNATHQKEAPITSNRCSQVTSKYQRSNMPTTDFLNIPAAHHSSTSSIAYPYNIMNSHSHLQSSLGPGSLARPPVIPVHTGSKPSAAVSMIYKNRIKVRDRMRSKPLCAKDSDNGKKTKKRSAAKVDDSTKPTKIPNLEIQEDSSNAIGLRSRGNLSGNIHCASGLSELNSNRDEPHSVGCGPGESQEQGLRGAAGIDSFKLDEPSSVECGPDQSQEKGFRSAFGIDSFKLDGVTRTGPIKLGAGAKHILKPSHHLDQAQSRPTHSAIPFGVVTDSIRAQDSQNKSAKIYSF